MKKLIKALFATTLFTAIPFTATKAQAMSVSPQNWWVGMQNEALQVMLHEPNIAKQQWQLIPYNGVELISISKTDNPRLCVFKPKNNAASKAW